jgi:hypothetical protein
MDRFTVAIVERLRLALEALRAEQHDRGVKPVT